MVLLPLTDSHLVLELHYHIICGRYGIFFPKYSLSKYRCVLYTSMFLCAVIWYIASRHLSHITLQSWMMCDKMSHTAITRICIFHIHISHNDSFRICMTQAYEFNTKPYILLWVKIICEILTHEFSMKSHCYNTRTITAHKYGRKCYTSWQYEKKTSMLHWHNILTQNITHFNNNTLERHIHSWI